MILVIDNYDSFTFNVVRYLRELGASVEVHRNDALNMAQVEALQPQKIVISPGPKDPASAGISVALIRHLGARIPILGVCLGHQCIGYAYGASVVRAKEVMHGKTSLVHHCRQDIYAGLPDPFRATRYHSLVLDVNSLPDCLQLSAWTQTPEGSLDEVMGVRHRDHPVFGLQFHPESILSEHGHQIFKNFLEI